MSALSRKLPAVARLRSRVLLSLLLLPRGGCSAKSARGYGLLCFGGEAAAPQALQARVLGWYQCMLAHPGERRLKKPLQACFAGPLCWVVLRRAARNAKRTKKLASRSMARKHLRRGEWLGGAELAPGFVGQACESDQQRQAQGRIVHEMRCMALRALKECHHHKRRHI